MIKTHLVQPGEHMKRYIFLLLLICTLANASDLRMPLLWTINTHTFLESAPILADIDGDKRSEIITAGREELIVLQDNGKEVWRWHARGRYMTYPAILSREKEQALLYAADNTGQLTCLNAQGRVVWQADLNGSSSWAAAAVGKLAADQPYAVVQTDEKGTVSAFDALTGRNLFRTTVKGMPVSPALGDINGDGHAEIVVTTGDGLVYAIAPDGKIIWQKEIGGSSETWSTSSPVIFNASDGQAYIAAASSIGKIFCIDQQGNVAWQAVTKGPVASSLSVADFDNDGKADIFLITQLGVIYRFDENGRRLWEIDMQGRSLAAGAILDVNNDGKLEYILSTQQGYLLALDNQGSTIFSHQFNNRTINVTPAFGDVTGSAQDLEMVITGGETGQIFCFATPASITAKQPWPLYRGNALNTGAWLNVAKPNAVTMTPQNLLAEQIVSGECIRFSINNPKPGQKPFRASATCISPAGEQQTAMASMVGKQGDLQLPVEIRSAGAYRFSWTLTDDFGQTVVNGERTLSLQPFANDRALLTQALSSLDATADAVQSLLPLSSSALRKEAQQLKILAQPLHAEVTDQESFRKMNSLAAQIVKKSKRASQMCKIVEQAQSLGANTSVIPFTATTWENRLVDEQLPGRIQNPLLIHRSVVRSEHESIPVSIFNITDRTLQVQVQIDSLPAKMTVTLHRSVCTPTNLGEISWDALPELDESGVIEIPSLSSRELWLDIATGAAAPGTHRFKINLLALNGSGVLDAPTHPHAIPAPRHHIAVSLNILPFTMAPSGVFRLCTWSPSQGPCLNDLLTHGNNVFNAPHGKPKYNDKGELLDIDFSRLDQIIQGMQGFDVIFLLSGFPELSVAPEKQGYQNALGAYLDKLVQHMAQKGIDLQHFALYPIDEPGGVGWTMVNKLVEFGKTVRACNPKIMMYVDGGGEKPMFEAMAPVIDIWTPGIFQLAEDSPEMKIMRTNGQMLWSYNCAYGFSRPTGPNLKNINIIAEYRAAALFAMRHKASGIGFWCYNAGGENAWERIKYEYNIVYPGRSKPVTSRRWEAVREGIEDYRILSALQSEMAKTGNAALPSDVRNRLKHLLEISLPELVDQSFIEMTMGLARHVLDASSNDIRMEKFRQEMMSCVEEACKANK
jgi:outer membrane protein assembly factor BamB